MITTTTTTTNNNNNNNKDNTNNINRPTIMPLITKKDVQNGSP